MEADDSAGRPADATGIRRIRSPRWVHYTLFVCVLAEVLELELLASGLFHHVWDLAVLGVYAGAAWSIDRKRRYAAIIGSAGLGAWAMDLSGWRWEGADIEAFLWAVTHAAVAIVLARAVFAVDDVTGVELTDAACLFMVAGIAFANVYAMVLWVYPDALTHPSVPAGQSPSYSLVIYYSFISQLTVGYGDMAPAHRLTRTISIVQALFGVMYVAILISWFVGRHSAARSTRTRSG